MIDKKLEEDYLFGCICYSGFYHFYLMPIAWWIINYAKYDPSILSSTERQKNFRNGILVVDNTNKKAFLEAVNEDKLQQQEIIYLMEKAVDVRPPFYFFINIDSNLYVSGFPDIEIEEYIPENWAGKFDNPITYLPQQERQLLNNKGA